jgi:hypothetical protein
MYNNDDDDGYNKTLTKLFTYLLTDSLTGYSIEPSVDLWNSIDFNQSKLPKDNTSKTKRVSKYAESCENLMASNLSFGESASSSVNSSLNYNESSYSTPSKYNTITPKQTTTPPSFKVTTSDNVPVASSNGAASRASIQVEQLKKTLLQLEAQKVEAEDRRKQAELDKLKVLTHSLIVTRSYLLTRILNRLKQVLMKH